MRRVIDVTIDFETCALTANAALMQLAAVAWDRRENPCASSFVLDDFNERIDLASCVFDGFDFDKGTMDWWSKQSGVVKDRLLAMEPKPVKTVLDNFLAWLDGLQYMSADASGNKPSIILWSQGADFDIAILRNALAKYGMRLPFNQKYLRDARTLALEAGAKVLSRMTEVDVDHAVSDMKKFEKSIYNVLSDGIDVPDNYLSEDNVHDAAFDAWRTAVTTRLALDV